MTLPLEGIRVVEVAQYVAGPLAGSVLSELGADVIKVEPPGGDAYRQRQRWCHASNHPLSPSAWQPGSGSWWPGR